MSPSQEAALQHRLPHQLGERQPVLLRCAATSTVRWCPPTQTPFVNFAWTLTPGLIWKAEYNYYGYGEGGPPARSCAAPQSDAPPATPISCATAPYQTGMNISPAGETAAAELPCEHVDSWSALRVLIKPRLFEDCGGAAQGVFGGLPFSLRVREFGNRFWVGVRLGSRMGFSGWQANADASTYTGR